MNEIHEFNPQSWPSNRLHNTTFMEKSAIKLIYFDTCMKNIFSTKIYFKIAHFSLCFKQHNFLRKALFSYFRLL